MIKQSLPILFLISVLHSSCGLDLPEPHALEYDDSSFNELANLILNQQSIYEMDDFTRSHKKINGVSVKLNSGEGDQEAQYLYIVEDSLKLDPKIVSALRVKLEETELRDFVMSGDSILFTVDGFLDDAWGFMYTKSESKMDSTWFMFKGSTVKFVENINDNWKRTAIR